ncbi:MAG: glycosyltransferase [Paracoccus sp. (in: a-proteobacteria)]|uniref:glycosyltransferase n=1 Tax=Paracoccus sp. TaxID=267 RepID=UPI0026DF73B0|nr:glycosyltransferase [Paracoccus sp. (in: a-proteobacteria)]MDO5611800.1 glycosyltransferase [Paracoccus sp. (in: a-proteobacteria)]
MPQIVILMATYNGAAFLPRQLASIAAQTHRNWRLICSDDGSTDDTRAVIAGFAAGHTPGQVQIIDGPRAGATANFLHLIAQAAPGAWLAFSDQDDDWHPDKLHRAVAMTTPRPGPAHYSARTLICDADLNVLTESPRFARPFGLRNALVQACTAGNTSVFNPAAAAILQAGAAAARAAHVVSHDWWAYQLIAGAGGAILKDDTPVLKYRQHGANEMGRNDTAAARRKRLAMLFDGSFGGWLAANHAALTGAGDLLTARNRAVLHDFGAALHAPGPVAAARLARLGLYRHETAGTAALYAAAAMGRLRCVTAGDATGDGSAG